ncbi:M23 family metallopeptidase [Benzoatithermus flavus]|uniref:M23 family metallopeptidase n=1 Tax=Benzoatithermus flavus TaxID=3108223 RepID=A0ABU8XS46_9PROT
MTKPSFDAFTFGRLLKASLLAGLLSLMLLSFAPIPAAAVESEACGTSVMQMGMRAVGAGFRLGAQYMDPHYRGYRKPVRQEGYGTVYIQHTGRDFIKSIGTPVRAVAPGRVAYNTRGTPGQPASKFTFIRGSGVTWAYGHILPAVRVGQSIRPGQLIGYIANPRGMFPPHVHIGAITLPYPTRNRAVNAAMNAGRAFGRTPGQAAANARRYTMDPLRAFARAEGRRC